MSDAELVDCLAGSLELLANRCAELLGRSTNTVDLRIGLRELRDNAREAAALAGEPRDDPTEETLRALQSVALDYQTGRGTGTLPAVSETTWGRVKVALRRRGVPVED